MNDFKGKVLESEKIFSQKFFRVFIMVIILLLFTFSLSGKSKHVQKYDDKYEKITIDWSWQDNPTRESICLNGEWDFMPMGKNRNKGAKPDTLKYPPSGKWDKKKIRVPSYWPGCYNDFNRKYAGSMAWYRRNFIVPDSMKNKRIKLCFKQVNFDATVYVNGDKIGRHRSETEFEFDITSHVKFDGNNLLEVAVIDCTNAFVGHVAVCPIRVMYDMPQSGITGDVFLRVYPECHVKDVFVITSTREKSISTEITVSNETMNNRTVKIKNEIINWNRHKLPDKTEKMLEGAELVLRGGETRTVKLTTSWSDPKLWWPDSPHLYELVTKIYQDNKLVDTKYTRFGFREFYIKGRSFYLNGIKFNLRGDSAGYITEPGSVAIRLKMPSFIRELIKFYKQCNTNSIRCFSPVPEYYDIADEMGFILIDGTTSCWNRDRLEKLLGIRIKNTSGISWEVYDYHKDEKLLKEFFRDLTIRRRNHPSIFAVCMQNEFYAMKKDFGKYLKLIRELDPTRPLYSDGAADSTGRASIVGPTGQKGDLARSRDIDGLADILSQHYPYSYGGCGSSGYWPQYYMPGMLYIYDGQKNLQNHTSQTIGKIKPLSLGEFISQWDTPDMLAFLGGDETYKNLVDPWNGGFARTVGESVGMQLECLIRYYGIEHVAFHELSRRCPGRPADLVKQNIKYPMYPCSFKWKRLDTPGFKPNTAISGGYVWINVFNRNSAAPRWIATPTSEAVKKAYSPILLQVRELDHTFISGRTVRRTVTVNNDTTQPLTFRLEWVLSGSRTVAVKNSKTFEVGPGELILETVLIKMPAVEKRTEMELKFTLSHSGKTDQSITQKVSVFPDRLPVYSVNKNTVLAVFDVEDTLTEILTEMKIPYEDIKVKDIKQVPFNKYALLLLRYHPYLASRFEDLNSYVRNGGRVILFGSSNFKTSLPFDGLSSDGKPVSLCFVRMFGHPLLSGIEKDDLKWWQNQYNISAYDSYFHASGKNIELLAQNGKGVGLNHSPLFLKRLGQGFYIICNMLITEEFDRNPVARLLAGNMINYALHNPVPYFDRVGLLSNVKNSITATVFKTMGIDYGEINSPQDVAKYQAIVIDGVKTLDKAYLEAVKKEVAKGARVLVKGLDPQNKAVFESLTGVKLELKPSQLRHPQLELKDFDPVFSQISNSNLYWFLNGRPTDKIVKWVFPSGTLTNPGISVLAVEPVITKYLRNRDHLEILLSGRGEWPLTKINNPGAGIIKVSKGKGFYLIDQTLWDDYSKNPKIQDYITRLLSGLKINTEKAGKNLNLSSFRFINIASYCNQKNTRRMSVPVGIQVFRKDIPYQIVVPGNDNPNTCIYVGKLPNVGGKLEVPMQLKGIKINAKLRRLYFLQATFWKLKKGETVVEYVINYADGNKLNVPVRYGIDAADWYGFPPAGMKPKVSFIGRSLKTGESGVLYTMDWKNPYPNKEIKSLDIINHGQPAVLWLAGITGRK